MHNMINDYITNVDEEKPAHNNIITKIMKKFIKQVSCSGYWSYTDCGNEFDCEGVEDENGDYCESCLCCLNTFGRYDPNKGHRSILYSLIYHYIFCDKTEWNNFKQSFNYCMKHKIYY